MTQTSIARRVATVSGGTLLLCLSLGGTALAATTPASGSSDPVGTVTGTVSSVAGALPTPTPIPTPTELAVVDQTVSKVSQAAGGVVPAATPTPTAVPTGGGKTGKTTKPAGQVHAPRPSTREHSVLGAHHSRGAVPSVAPMAALQLGGLRGAAAPVAIAPV